MADVDAVDASIGAVREEGLAALRASGSETGEDFPGAGASGTAVAAGELAADDRRSQLPFREIVGGRHVRHIETREEVVALLGKAAAERLFQRVGPWRGEIGLGRLFEDPPLGRRDRRAGALHLQHASQEGGPLVGVGIGGRVDNVVGMARR